MYIIFPREEPNKQMTVVFDCAGSGLKNIDMDNMQFVINSFKEDYPWCLNYILVYEMPWVMNGKGIPNQQLIRCADFWSLGADGNRHHLQDFNKSLNPASVVGVNDFLLKPYEGANI